LSLLIRRIHCFLSERLLYILEYVIHIRLENNALNYIALWSL
jgi:hypothetical protein